MSNRSLASLFLLSLLISLFLAQAARPEPAGPKQTQQQLASEEDQSNMDADVCEGVGGDECLMRRTLQAHLDYIYTQGKKH